MLMVFIEVKLRTLVHGDCAGIVMRFLAKLRGLNCMIFTSLENEFMLK